MKKKFLCFILCFSLLLTSLLFVGCNKNYTKEDFANLYSSIQEDEKTKDFFVNNEIKVVFTNVDMGSTKKGYIFPEVYDYYLLSSNGLFSSIVKRYDGIASIPNAVAYSVKDFSSEQINDLYKKLSNVKTCLITLSDSKSVYETTDEKLHYKELLSDYNNLINSLYNFNFAYANYYFNGVGKVDFSSEELSDINVRNMLWFLLLHLSKVTFNYELLSYTPSNPLGEVKNSFIEKTEYMKLFLEICDKTKSNLNLAEDLTLIISNKNQVKNVFCNVQRGLDSYEIGYQSFLKAINNVDLKNYMMSANKQAFIENNSNVQKSNFQLISNFLDGKYKAFYNGLKEINRYM